MSRAYVYSKWCCFRAARLTRTSSSSGHNGGGGMCRLGCTGQYGALIKRSFDIWLLEGLFPCCCFFPLGGMKQAHHKNRERARFAHAMRAHKIATGDGLGEFARGCLPACALTDSSFANWSGLRESHAAALRLSRVKWGPPHMQQQPTNTTT